MKRILKTIMTVALFLGLVCFNTSIANAATVSSVSASASGNTISVSGSCDASVTACAILVYDSAGTTLVDMETCAASGGAYSYTLSNSFAAGTYVVKVADYNGGDYASTNVTIAASATATTPAAVPTSPKTNDNYMYYTLTLIAIGATLLSICLKRRYDKKH